MSLLAVRLVLVAGGVGAIVLGVLGGRVLAHGGTPLARVRRGFGTALAVAGLYIAVGGVAEVHAPVRVVWMKDEARALGAAQAGRRPVFIDFYADWCESCKALDHRFFSREDVATALAPYVTLRADMTAGDDRAEAMQRRYGVAGLPTLVLLPPDGDPTRAVRLTSTAAELQDPASLVRRLDAFRAAGGGGGAGGRATGFAATVEGALSGPLLWALLVVLLGGVLSSFTPCVYPLIPITVAVIGARQAATRGQAFRLSLVYVAGIAVTYSALGTAAASAGGLFGAAMQNPWVVGGVSAVLGLMGLSMLGLFEIQLPTGLQTRLSRSGGAGYLGALLMGLVAGLVAAPCVGPVLVVLLAFVARLGNPWVGFLVLLDYALGMGLLFLLLGTFSGLLGRLPRSGNWMFGVKAAFGIVFLTLALWYLKDVFPALRAVFVAAQGLLVA